MPKMYLELDNLFPVLIYGEARIYTIMRLPNSQNINVAKAAIVEIMLYSRTLCLSG